MSEKKPKLTEGLQKLLFYSALLLIIISGATALLLSFQVIQASFWVSLVLVTGFVFSLTGFIWFYRRHRAHQIKSRDLFLTSLYTVIPQMEIIYSFFISMESIKKMEEDEELTEVYEVIKTNLSRIRQYMMVINQYSEILELRPLTVPLIEAAEGELKKINKNLYDLSVNIIGAVEGFKRIYYKGQEVIQKSNQDMARVIFYLANSIPVLSDLAKETNIASKDIILRVINQFEEIADFSHHIHRNVRTTMSNLTDEKELNSLAFIMKKAKLITQSFKKFSESMESLKKVSTDFVGSSSAQLHNISEIAGSIEKISATIKVISLNVNIEAAKTSENSKGFQVLAKDLREFAEKTMKFAQDVKNTVKQAIQSTEGLKKHYHENMETVYLYMDEIKKSILSFEEIIQASFDKIRSVIDSLETFSDRIDSGIKGIVGNLQHYDIRSQEVEHLSSFTQYIFDRFNAQYHNMDTEEILSEQERNRLRRDILEYLDSIITTGPERKILESYEKVFDVKIEKNFEIANNAPEELKDQNQNVILF